MLRAGGEWSRALEHDEEVVVVQALGWFACESTFLGKSAAVSRNRLAQRAASPESVKL